MLTLRTASEPGKTGFKSVALMQGRLILDSAGCKPAAKAYSAWGKGVNPARLNFGDCFACALAKAHGAPLLRVGDDFAKTDIVSATEK